MADTMNVSLTLSMENKLKKGKKRSINIRNWKDNRRKLLKDSGSPYLSKRNVYIPGKIPSNAVSRTMLYLTMSEF